MKVLWSSNAGWTGTGYGTQTKHITRGIQELGHDVAVFAWWGLMGGPLTIDGVQHFPAQIDGYGNDATPYYARKWHADLLITLIDLWVLDPNILGRIGGTQWAPYFPIDHANPVPDGIAARFDNAKRLLVYSKWAESLVKEYSDGKYASRVRYIPHGIDTRTLTPVTRERRAEIRHRLYPDWPDDAFICGMVAANKGFPSRKSFPDVMEAFAKFSTRHPEARLYLHSYPHKDFQGPPLDEMARAYGIASKVRLPNPRLMLGGGFDDKMIADIYRSFDVLLSPSQGEGFGLPIVEAQACFPGLTKVHVANPTETHRRNYTGPLYTIKTKRGLVRATAEHPFWTDQGWLPAKYLTVGTRLLYNGSKHPSTEGIVCRAKGPERVYRGRVESACDAADFDAAARSGEGDGPNLLVNHLAGAPESPAQAVGRDRRGEVLVPDGSGAWVYSGPYRWRRHGDDPQDAGSGLATRRFDREYVTAVDGVVVGKDRRTFVALDGAIQPGGALPVSDAWPDVPPALEGAPASARNQAGADAARDRVDRGEAGAGSGRAVPSAPPGDHLGDPGAEYEAVDSVYCEWVSGLPVYNFGTETGVYYAEGYLVHNCGVPVIVNDHSAMSELVGGGWRCKPRRLFKSLLWAEFAEADPIEIEHRLEECIRVPNIDYIRAAAREFAFGYSWPKVIREYWAPFLSEMDAGRREISRDLRASDHHHAHV